MSVWKDNSDNEYLLEYWGSSSIGWQQQNRDVLNSAIRTYNNYVRKRASLDEVVEAVEYAESVLKDEPGSYMDDINTMKSNVDKIELNRQGGVES